MRWLWRWLLLSALLSALFLCCPGSSIATLMTCLTQEPVPLAPGNQTISCGGLGSTVPKAALLLLTAATVNNTPANGAMLAIGATDCTDAATAGYRAQDLAAGSTNSDAWGTNTKILNVPDLAANSIAAAATFSSCGAGSLTITWSPAPPAAYLLHVLFWAGTEPQAAAGTLTTNATIGNSTTITPGFQTHLLVLFGLRGAINNSNILTYGISLGFADYDGTTITQRALGWDSQSGAATSSVLSNISTNYAFQICNVAVCNTSRVAADITSITSTTVVATTRNEAVANGMGYLALHLGTRRHWLGTITTPASPGTLNITNPGWKPSAGMLLISRVATTGTEEQDGDAGSFGVSLLNDTTAYSLSQAMEDNIATGSADAQSLTVNQAVSVPDQAGAALFAATHTFTATGVDLAFSATEQRRWIGWFLEQAPVVPAAVANRRAVQWSQ